jgi:hypothetical protein
VVSWIVWRGPGDVTFTPRFAQPRDGRTDTTATFTVPGEYVLRAVASDGRLTTPVDVPVTVKGN